MRLRRFHSWTPGAVWTPPAKFYLVNYKRELLRVCQRLLPAPARHNPEQFIRDWALQHSSSADVRKQRRALPQLVKPKIADYSQLLVSLYDQKNKKAMVKAYKRLPSPRPKFVDGHVLDDMLVELQRDLSGNGFRQILDDLDEADYPVTTKERAYYISSLSRAVFGDKDHARRLVTSKMLSWTRHFEQPTKDLHALNLLLQTSLELGLFQLQDFCQSRLGRGDRHTARLLLEFNKLEPISVLKEHIVPPALLNTVLRKMLQSNPAGAHDLLAYVTSLRHTRTRPMSTEEQSFCNKAIQVIEHFGGSGIPQVPSPHLFDQFLEHYTAVGDFGHIRRTLVEMASHGCFPSERALRNVLSQARGLDDLDLLIHYLCDVSLYHKILTVDLAHRICANYRDYDPQVALELEKFLVSIVRQQPELVPTEPLTLEPAEGGG